MSTLSLSNNSVENITENNDQNLDLIIRTGTESISSESTKYFDPKNISESTYIPLRRLKDRPVYISCPHCKDFILTEIKRRPGFKSIISCCFVSIFAFCGCCFIPCFSKKCTDAIHICPQCSKIIAIWERKLI